MIYLIVFAGLIILELLYFRIATFFNIVDKPNARSSHTVVTLRGGGVIFYITGLLYFILSGFQYPWFFLGLTIMASVSFLDDIFTLSNRLRLLAHFSSVLLMSVQLDVFTMPWLYLLMTFVVTVGIINAFNFMDGINGITASYSLAVGMLLIIINQAIGFIAQDLLIYSMLGVIVFGFFNFRTKAKCFAGDVGSVTIAYILTFALGALILKTGNLLYFLFLAVYGIDTVWTIIRRLYLKENIFEAHRSHLYQLLGNEAGGNKLLISFCYGAFQFFLGLAVIYMANRDASEQLMFSLIVLGVLSLFYLLLKTWVIRKYNRSYEIGDN